MSVEVRITQAAWADVDRIYEWIRARGAPRAADRWFNSWLERVRNLESFPEGRSPAPETADIPEVEVHQQLFGRFRSLYVVRGDQVFIVHVRRAVREPATLDELQTGVQEALQQDRGSEG